MFNRLEVNVPVGLRAGKYLQKIIIKEGLKDINLPSLVEGLNSVFEFSLAENYKDWEEALNNCHSCQSDDSIKELYHNVWTKMGVNLAIVRKGGKIVGRCLVNVETNKMAQTYGEFHYILQARLKFAGFSEGELIAYSEIQEELQNMQDKKDSMGHEKRPKSKTYAYEETLRDNSEEYKRLLHNRKIWRGMFDYDNETSQKISAQRRYLKHIRKQGLKIGDPVTVKVVTTRPISDEWEYFKESTSVESSEIYLDFTRSFVQVVSNKKASWYKKAIKTEFWWGALTLLNE